MLHGNELWSDFFQFFPETSRQNIRDALKRTFNNYFVGQLTVASVMGVSITITFLIIQIPFGLLFGFGSWFNGAIPFWSSLKY